MRFACRRKLKGVCGLQSLEVAAGGVNGGKLWDCCSRGVSHRA